MLDVPVNGIGQATVFQVPDMACKPRLFPLYRVQLVNRLLLRGLHRWIEGGSVLPDPPLEVSRTPRVEPAGPPFEAD